MNVARKTLASAAALALAALIAGPASPAAAQAAPAGGFADAQGIIVNLVVLTAVPVPGALGNTALDPNTFAKSSQSCPPQTAEPATDNLINVAAPPAVTANTINTIAGARCDGPTAVASAQTEGLTALVNAGVPLITADAIRAQSNSDCTKAPNGDGSLFVNLKVAGQPIANNPAPNTRITIPGVATVIINEQSATADGRGFVVNGIHVIGASPLLRGDLIISHAVSGVVCPNGAGSTAPAPGQPFAPDIRFDKDARPTTARTGETVTYTAVARNTSTRPCDVIRFVDHLDPAFEFVSTSGGFGDKAVMPVPVRSDKGQDVTIDPRGVIIAPGAAVTQTIVVKVRDETKPGTYFNNLEIFCAVGGNFASGPLAPVTVPAAAVPPVVQPPPPPAPEQLPRTGAAPLLALGALLLVGAGLGVRRFSHR